MTAQDVNVLGFLNTTLSDGEEFSSPIDITDIISICKEYNKLGWQIQNQVENIIEFGVEESIKSGFVKQESLPHIREFLIAVSRNPYFGEAILQAQQCVDLILKYEKDQVSPLN